MVSIWIMEIKYVYNEKHAVQHPVAHKYGKYMRRAPPSQLYAEKYLLMCAFFKKVCLMLLKAQGLEPCCAFLNQVAKCQQLYF
ncbi:hypothetical protein HanRHA438_Chr17g0828471 [Helianthus annuus]|nr:hypothetical protein HanRHA438_Chr17g0828471 [Helianthus annuus]